MLHNRQGDLLIVDILIYVFFGLFTLICMLPFYYIFINTISSNDVISTGRIYLWPVGIHFTNYVKIFEMRGIPQAALISFGRTVLGTLATVACSCFLGYTLSRREFWKRAFWYRFVVISMYFNAGIIPWFITMRNLKMVDHFLAYIVPSAVMPFFLILYKTYYESIPASLEESAELDGAGYIVRFTRIVFPLSLPIVATIAVFSAVNQWNAFSDTLFLMRNSRLYTLQFLLYQFLNEVSGLARLMRNSSTNAGAIDLSRMLTPTSIRMTISMVVILPILFVYPFFQRFFIKGIMIGAVKG